MHPTKLVLDPLGGASNDTWDGSTIQNIANGKSNTSDKSGEIEGPINKIPSMECNKKWASLFATKHKGKAISSVPHKVDRESSACSISIPYCIVD